MPLINEHVDKKRTFINNNIFSGCLHSMGVVLHVHLDLQESMLLYQPPRRSEERRVGKEC